jgi:hypothetical protein
VACMPSTSAARPYIESVISEAANASRNRRGDQPTIAAQ